jgi:putative oxygen-independent coproporphyrinogen III oxidase
MRLPPLSMYLHLPWCVRKCPYCDFNSHAAPDDAPRGQYLDALVADLDHEAARADGRPLVSVYIGGGTPSLFTGAEIGRLIDAIADRFTLCSDIEISMEVNPGTVETNDLGEYAKAGVNRLSLGAQSFDAAMLEALGRIHGPREIHRACNAAAAAGFDSINLDLMFALPGQTPEMALSDIEQAKALGPAHISCYQLTVEPNTVFYARPPRDLPDEEQAAEIQSSCHAALVSGGYEQYETSAYARAGYRCRHNLNYWTFGDYLAAGAGAHGKLTDNDGTIRRYEKPKYPLTYIEQAEARSIEDRERIVTAAETTFEYMLNVLRLSEGFDVSDYTARTGLPADSLAPGLATAVDNGMLRPKGAEGWQPTELGQRFQNDLVAIFLP